ncbi:hypothetical protein JCM14720_00850 [Calditerricola yamamurae]
MDETWPMPMAALALSEAERQKKIREAWERSRRYGVPKGCLPTVAPVPPEELARRKAHNRILLDVAQPFLDHLFEQIKSRFIVVICDADGILLHCRGERLPDPLLQHHTTEGLCWKESVYGANALGTALATGEPMSMVGREHYCEAFYDMTCAATPLRDAEGRLIGGLAVAAYREEHSPYLLGMVLSTGYAIEQAYLLKSQNLYVTHLFNQLIHTTDEPVLICTEEGAIELMNRAARRKFGDYEGAPVDRIFSRHNAISISLRERRSLRDFRETFVHPVTGETREYLWETFWLDDSARGVRRLVACARDITRVVELERALKQMERLGVMGRFSAQIAHEIRNPLAIIRLAMQLMKEKGVFSGPYEEKANLILNELDRITELVQHFLRISKPAVPKRRKSDVVRLVSETCRLLESEMVEKNITLVEHYDEAVPLIDLDPDQIRQVLINLIQNAIEATAAGGQITVAVNRLEADVLITVADTGPGISTERWDEIFEPFYTTKPWGIGLGLANSKAIVEAHDGTLDVSSVPGEGTKIFVYLPIH